MHLMVLSSCHYWLHKCFLELFWHFLPFTESAENSGTPLQHFCNKVRKKATKNIKEISYVVISFWSTKVWQLLQYIDINVYKKQCFLYGYMLCNKASLDETCYVFANFLCPNATMLAFSRYIFTVYRLMFCDHQGIYKVLKSLKKS